MCDYMPKWTLSFNGIILKTKESNNKIIPKEKSYLAAKTYLNYNAQNKAEKLPQNKFFKSE